MLKTAFTKTIFETVMVAERGDLHSQIHIYSRPDFENVRYIYKKRYMRGLLSFEAAQRHESPISVTNNH